MKDYSEFKNFLRKRFCDELSDEQFDLLTWKYKDEDYEEEIESCYEDIKELVGAKWVNTGESKIVFYFSEYPEWVVKIPFQGVRFVDEENTVSYTDTYTTNYCEAELCYYYDAINEEVEDAFAEEHWLFDMCGADFYCAEYCELMTCDKMEASEKARTVAEKIKKNSISPYNDIFQWTPLLIDCYGEEFSKRVVDFIIKQDIEDLHNENVGFSRDGKFKLIDYSGFGS